MRSATELWSLTMILVHLWLPNEITESFSHIWCSSECPTLSGDHTQKAEHQCVLLSTWCGICQTDIFCSSFTKNIEQACCRVLHLGHSDSIRKLYLNSVICGLPSWSSFCFVCFLVNASFIFDCFWFLSYFWVLGSGKTNSKLQSQSAASHLL